MASSATPADSPTAAALQLNATKESKRSAALPPSNAGPSSGSKSSDASPVPPAAPTLQLFAPRGALEASGGAPGRSGSPVTTVRHRQGARQSALASRSTLRPKVSRGVAVATAVVASVGEHQQEAADFPGEDGEPPQTKNFNSSFSGVASSEVSPTGKVNRLQRVPRPSGGGTSGAGIEEGGSRLLRRGPNEAASASAGTGITVQAAGGASAGADPIDYRGLRRSLRQALLATSGKTYSPGVATGCVSGGAEGQQNSSALGAPTAPGAPAPLSITNASGVPGGGGKRRMRQAQKQLLQSYVVGQQHQQVGPQEEGQDTVTCLAEWLGIDSSVPSCCCGSGCASCGVKFAAVGGPGGSSSSNSNTLASSHASRAGSGGTMRSVLDVYATAGAKRQKQLPAVPKLQRSQQQRPIGASQRKQEDAILVSPSWFDVPADMEPAVDFCVLRPASPSRPATFFAQQEKWEAQDKLEAAEAAAATAGTPWPKGSTSCSFGGYGAATRCGGALPLCCYCGLPLRPPSLSLRGQGAESGCPLMAAAAAAANLGMEGWTQWCRCCTRVYGDLRLQHQRDASWLPFTSFVVPKAPLRYVMLPADGAKDTPGGAQSIAAALAAAAAAESRRNKAIDDSTATNVSAEGDPESAVAQAGTSGNTCSSSSSSTTNATTSGSLRRTRSGQHFSRAPAARSGGRNSGNSTDIMRFLGASCCWPSCNSEHSFVQPIARLQQQLTHLQQQFSEQPSQPHLQQQPENHWTPFRVSHEEGFNPSRAQPAVLDEESLPTAAPAAASLQTAETSTGSTAAPGTTSQKVAAGYGAAGSEAFLQSEASSSGVDFAFSVDAPLSTPSAQGPENVRRQCSSSVVQTLPAEAAQRKIAGFQTAARTVVIPRVYLESKTSCYVATAFDAPRRQLLQKRFCCLILGEQRAHALACQWLRWVQRWRADTTQKPRSLLAHP